jgi:hypothetical protein
VPLFIESYGLVTIALVTVALILTRGKPDIDIEEDFARIFTDPCRIQVEVEPTTAPCLDCSATNTSYQIIESNERRRVASIRYERSEHKSSVVENLDVWVHGVCGIILTLENNVVIRMKRIGGINMIRPRISHQEYEEIFGLIRRIRAAAKDPFAA